MPLMIEDKSLLNFFVFYSNFGQEEGYEHRKILYYYPKKDCLETQVKNVCLVEAITKFSRTFNAESDCDSLHTQKTHQIFYQSEESVWIVLTVAVGWAEKEKECGSYREYHGDAVQDQVLKSEVIRAYDAFRLRNESILTLLHSQSCDGVENPVKLKDTLCSFFDQYLSGRDLVNGGVERLWGDVCFLPLDKLVYLKVYSSLAAIENQFPGVVHSTFLYRHNFIWSGFQMEDMPAVSQLLLSLMPNVARELNSSTRSAASGSNLDSNAELASHACRLLGESATPTEEIYIRDPEGVVKLHRLVLASIEDALLCLCFPGDKTLSKDVFSNVTRAAESAFKPLLSELREQCLKRRQASGSYKYLYHNKINLATKSCLLTSNDLPKETLQSLVDMRCDMEKCDSSELVVKTSSDQWVVGRRGNGREYYVLVTDKNANLSEVTAEVNKISDSLFKSVFLVK